MNATARFKAFSTEVSREYRYRVEPDGSIVVWDSVAGHYTRCHAITTRTAARLRRVAQQSK